MGKLYAANSNIPASGALNVGKFRGQTAPRPAFALTNTSGTGMSMNTSGTVTGTAGGNLNINFQNYLTPPGSLVYQKNLTFSIAPALPSGGTFNSSGVMSIGTTVAAIAGSRTVTALNSWGKSVTIPIGLSIIAALLTSKFSIAGGFAHTILLDSTGKAHAFGNSTEGQLGNGYIAPYILTPFQIGLGTASDQTISQVSCGYYHTILLDSSGKAHAFGKNDFGQLGDGTTTTPILTPFQIGLGPVSGKTIIQVACGESHTILLDSTGKAHGFGKNNRGQLSDGAVTTTPISTPFQINAGTVSGKTISRVSCGFEHTILLDSTGKAHAFGRNDYGQLGNGTTTTPITTPFQIGAGTVSGKTISVASCGLYHTILLDSTGKAHAFGYNEFGQLGDGTLNSPITTPFQIGLGTVSGKTINQVTCTRTYSIMLDSTGKAHAFGLNNFGQLGDGTLTSKSTPFQINLGTVIDKTIIQVTCGGAHTILLDSTGKVHTIGLNDNSQLGDATIVDKLTSIQIDAGTVSGKTIALPP